MFEVDMLNLGDADCILVTQWFSSGGCLRVLIDGGSGADAKLVREFLRNKQADVLYAAVCTHLHNDHAAGLIGLLEDSSLTVLTGWMHDLRNHVTSEDLRRAKSGNSSQADGARQVVENTERLARAFGRRGITPREPFAEEIISFGPSLTVLGPTPAFYRQMIEEFLGLDESASGFARLFPSMGATALAGLPPLPLSESFRPAPNTAVLDLLGGPLLPTLGLPAPPVRSLGLPPIGLPAPPPRMLNLSTSLVGTLSKSAVKENPRTQPYNNTSAIIGGSFNSQKLLFTADAGSEALDRIPNDWQHISWMQVPHHGSDGNLSQRNIETLCPQFAYISAKGDTDHPSRAVVNGLIKVGARVASTHKNGNLWLGIDYGGLPPGYGPLITFRGTAARTTR